MANSKRSLTDLNAVGNRQKALGAASAVPPVTTESAPGLARAAGDQQAAAVPETPKSVASTMFGPRPTMPALGAGGVPGAMQAGGGPGKGLAIGRILAQQGRR